MSDYYLLVDVDGNATEVKAEIKIGRSKTNDLVLTDPLASRHHATVYLEGDVPMIRDEQSVNGTIVNQRQIFDPVALKDKDSIQFGDEIFTVRAPLVEAETVLKSAKAAERGSAKRGKESGGIQKPSKDKSEKPKPEKSASPKKDSEPSTPVEAMRADLEDPLPPKKDRNNKVLIIAAVAAVVLCLCCIVTIVVVQVFGVIDLPM
jgi:pSer/pThr/pTyr-binding forkhead associated (FHA) protein